MLPEDANHVRPALIAKAIAKVVAYYAHSRETCWDDLSQGERQRRLQRQIRAAGGPDSDAGRPLARRLARWRQQRSERREALVAVLKLLLAYTDIATLTVAVPAGSDWLGLSAPWIATHADLSPSRVKRALATLSRAAWLASTGQGRRFDPRQRRWVGPGWGPVRRFSFRLIHALGLEVSWNKARTRHQKDARAAARPVPGQYTRPTPTRRAMALLPRPPATATETHSAALQTLHRQLTGLAAPQTETDPAARQAAAARHRQIAALVADGLTLAEARQRLNDAAQPP
ncbi:MAG: hypothetical protein IPK63_23075 [Candidatus Competibacteraceae bacterium]|nr:hypothetical protein [Candidatus Competibacteraceae bacterium]